MDVTFVLEVEREKNLLVEFSISLCPKPPDFNKKKVNYIPISAGIIHPFLGWVCQSLVGFVHISSTHPSLVGFVHTWFFVHISSIYCPYFHPWLGFRPSLGFRPFFVWVIFMGTTSCSTQLQRKEPKRPAG